MTLNAGAAVREISPPRDAALFGYPHVERTSTGVHDPLLASALFLEDDSRSVLLIALDLLFLDPPTARSIRRAVAREASVREASVFISCTHTHSGPVTCRLLGWEGDPAAPDPDPAYSEHFCEPAGRAGEGGHAERFLVSPGGTDASRAAGSIAGGATSALRAVIRARVQICCRGAR